MKKNSVSPWKKRSMMVTAAITIGISVSGGHAASQEADKRPVSVEMGVKMPLRDGVQLTGTIFRPEGSTLP